MLVFTSNWHFTSRFYRHKRNVRTVRVWFFSRQRWEMVSCRLGRLKCSVVNMVVHEWSCLSGLSVDEFQDLPVQFGQVLKAKIFNRCGILLVGLGGPTLMKKRYKMRVGSLPLSWNGRITQNSFWAWARQLEKHETGPHRMAEARPEEMISSQILRSRPGVCC